MKVLIVDDEPLARLRLARLLESHDHCEVVAQAENGEQAVVAYNQHEPDVVLMDIRMPIMDGLQAAAHLAKAEQPPAVIFCTAYNDYALEAFAANAVDYLLKPVNREKLSQAIEKAQRLNRVQINALIKSSNESTSDLNQQQRQHIFAKTSNGIELIAVEQVRYFLADQKYVTVYYLDNGKLKERLLDDSLKELEQQWAELFIRVHRNALVAVGHIQGIQKTPLGTQLKLADVETGPQISRRHLPEVRKLLQQL